VKFNMEQYENRNLFHKVHLGLIINASDNDIQYIAYQLNPLLEKISTMSTRNCTYTVYLTLKDISSKISVGFLTIIIS
jgi:hypothetical protein